jgi:tellurite resistance protein
MFLSEFNKKEAIAFVNLVEVLANIDQVFAENEKELLEEYIEELSLSKEDIKKLDFESAIKELEGSTDRIKNIIYFELVGLALSDGAYDEKEIQFLMGLAARFNISIEKQQEFINYFKMVKEVYDSTFVDYESKLEYLKNIALDII